MAAGGEEKAVFVGLKNDAEKSIPKIAEQHGNLLDSAAERGGKCLTAASENETAVTEKVTAEMPKDPKAVHAKATTDPHTVPEEPVKDSSLRQRLLSGDDGRARPDTPAPKYSNQALRDSSNFDQEIDEALRNRSITREQYDQLRVQQANSLSPEQIDDVVTVRNSIRIQDGQMVTKVLHPDVYRASMDGADHLPNGRPFDQTQWGGSIARGTDTADPTTPHALRDKLVLDDGGEGWSPVRPDRQKMEALLMTTFQERFRYRTVEVAVYRGAAYQAGGSERIKPFISLIRQSDDTVPPDLELYSAEDSVYLVRPEQLDAWYRSYWTYTWRGQPFTSIGAAGDDAVHGYYTGSSVSFANEHLTRVGATEYEGTVALREVEDLTEHREDLLAAWRGGQA